MCSTNYADWIMISLQSRLVFYSVIRKLSMFCRTPHHTPSPAVWHIEVYHTPLTSKLVVQPNNELTFLKFRKGTNWTMSRRTGSPLVEHRILSPPSSICMSLKSAFPMPTMMMDIGRCEAWTMASLVSAMSVMTPSVRMRRMKYCCWTQPKTNH